MSLLIAFLSVLALAANTVADDPAPKRAPARAGTKVPPASPKRAAAEPDGHAGHDHGHVHGEEATGTGDYYPENQMLGDVFADGYSDCGFGNCGRCGTCCGTLCNPGGCGMYVRADYLLWSTKGMNLPPLVTAGNPNNTAIPAGVINEDGSLPANTQVLFGNGLVNSQGRSGGRIVMGMYINPCWAIEGEYFGLADKSTSFQGASTATSQLAFPFFDESSNGLPAVFSCPDAAFAAQATTRVQGGGVRLLRNICCGEGCGPSWWDGCPVNVAKRVDFLLGYRVLRLDDNLTFEQTCDLNGVPRFGRDVFDTQNTFNGIDLGTMMQFRRRCWSLDLITKVGIGSTRSVVQINGVAFQNGIQQTPAGSILAVSTNSGTHINNGFTMLPELGLNVGYQINPCWRFTTGYTVMYWCGVYRPGDQIDQHINPNLWPPLPTAANTAGLWPQYPGRASDLWIQGVNFGLEARW
ncbi:MAG: BBP7 family outer membrane beta-barrel protein [Pirellulaceae bacterium]